MQVGEVERSYEERSKSIRDLRKLMGEDESLRKLKSDDDYLERFLYCTEYDVEEACNKMKTFYELLEECPEWFAQGNPMDKKSIIDKHICILTKDCDKENRPIYIVKIGNMNYSKMELVKDIVHVKDMFGELVLSESPPAAAKHGVCVLVDVSNFSWKLMGWLSPHNIKIILKRVTSLPVKEYRFHVINNSFLISAAITFIWPFLPQYIKDMIYFHFNDYDSLYEHVDQDVLPVEYGGKNKQNYDKYHFPIYEKSSQIMESFKVNRSMFLENVQNNTNKEK
ncbi:hypothetical protein JTB14_016189 [Gonioctena quinquepunctata]|nr:hypothetical protein JTB14_016189 [Gonioctena quinquepunctata]